MTEPEEGRPEGERGSHGARPESASGERSESARERGSHGARPESASGERSESARERGSHGAQPSGLRNPAAAVRGVGAGALAAEGLVLLLAIVPIRVLGGGGSGAGMVVIAALALASFVLAGLLRRRWAWVAGTVLQVVLFASGFLVHTSLAVLGVLFGLVWWYVLHVRRTILGRPPT